MEDVWIKTVARSFNSLVEEVHKETARLATEAEAKQRASIDFWNNLSRELGDGLTQLRNQINGILTMRRASPEARLVLELEQPFRRSAAVSLDMNSYQIDWTNDESVNTFVVKGVHAYSEDGLVYSATEMSEVIIANVLGIASEASTHNSD